MNNIEIIADSTCDLAPSLIKGTNLKILPLTITIDDRSYMDGEEISISRIYDAMRKGIVPKTAQIPCERVYNLFKSCFEAGRDFIYIAFSGRMSGCYTLANMVAEELSDQYPERKFAVIDSKGGSSATGLIVLQALRMARDGLPFEKIKAEIQFMTEHVEHVFSVEDLGWLAKGGRVPKLVGQAGNLLNIHPILDVENGCIVMRRMIQGQKRAVQTVANEIIRRAKAFPTQLIAINHADDLPTAKMLEKLIKEGLPNSMTTLCHIGGVLSVHIGLKGIGAYCFNRMPEDYKFV